MAEKEIRGAICHAIYRYAKADNKYMKQYDKNKESSYLKYCDVNNLYDPAMWQNLPVYNLEWMEDISQVNKDLINSYNEESDERYFLEDYVQYPEKLLIYMIKLNISFTLEI